MRRRTWSVLTMAALAALPLPAVAQEMCVALTRIAAAANEPAPFASLEGVRPSLVPGYGYCRVDAGLGDPGTIFCHTQLAPKSLIAEAVGAQVRDCLGATRVPNARSVDTHHEYRTDQLTIIVQSYCDERCQVGRTASLTIRHRREVEPVPTP